RSRRRLRSVGRCRDGVLGLVVLLVRAGGNGVFRLTVGRHEVLRLVLVLALGHCRNVIHDAGGRAVFTVFAVLVDRGGALDVLGTEGVGVEPFTLVGVITGLGRTVESLALHDNRPVRSLGVAGVVAAVG